MIGLPEVEMLPVCLYCFFFRFFTKKQVIGFEILCMIAGPFKCCLGPVNILQLRLLLDARVKKPIIPNYFGVPGKVLCYPLLDRGRIVMGKCPEKLYAFSGE